MLPRTAAVALLLAGCAHPSAQRGAAPPATTASASAPAPAPVPTPAPPAPQATVEFTRDVRPILESRCQPCHFTGGRMYDRLPFDRPETIRQLGTRLFTRIKDEGSQATIRNFLAQAP